MWFFKVNNNAGILFCERLTADSLWFTPLIDNRCIHKNLIIIFVFNAERDQNLPKQFKLWARRIFQYWAAHKIIVQPISFRLFLYKSNGLELSKKKI